MSNSLQNQSSNTGSDEFCLTETETSAMCNEFMLVTNTNSTLAMKILSQNQWNFERAINTYFDSIENESDSSSKNIYSFTSTDDQYKSRETKNNSMEANKNHFKLISWNIQGLESYALEIRTYGVIEIIEKEQPDAVFLQEVIPSTFKLIQSRLPQYNAYAGNICNYFVAILIHREKLQVHGFEVVEYPGTTMERNLLVVHTTDRNSVQIDLMTSHLESCSDTRSSRQRMEQLKLCFQRMTNAPSDRIVLFGGDLNLRESELQAIGNIPVGIYDLWIETGRRQEYKYTWDMKINTNLNFSSNGFHPQTRYDRLYYRPANTSDIKFKPIDFKLKGLEKLPNINFFCSDHWALETCFETQ